jgi:hypothetical protein
MPTRSIDTSVIGRTGLKRYAGSVREEWHPKLQGREGAKIYREMADNDPIVGAIMFAIKSLIRQADWDVTPADDSPEAGAAAEFFGSCLEDMSHTWEDLLSEILTMLPFGWAWFEEVYKIREGESPDPSRRSKYNDGKIGWRKIAIRAQDTLVDWEFDQEGGVQGMWQSAPPDFRKVLIPIGKSLLFRTESARNNPEGRSVLRNAYRPYYFLKRIQEIEAIGIERDLAGLPVMEVPPELMSPDATPEQKAMLAQFENLIQRIRRDEMEGVVIPAQEMSEEVGTAGTKTGYKLSLLSTGGRRQLDVNQVITRYEQRIAMSVLAEFIFLGMQDVGSRSLGQSKTSLFQAALQSIIDSIASVFNRHGIPRLMTLNGIPSPYHPKLTPGKLEVPSIDEIAKLIQAMSGAGAILFPDEGLENRLRGMVGLPQAAHEAEL